MKRAEQLARLLGITDDMILTEREYRCMIGTPPRTPEQETLFLCIRDMTGSIGNAAIPLSSYGLNVNDEGNIRRISAPEAPAFNVNQLLGKDLFEIAEQCGSWRSSYAWRRKRRSRSSSRMPVCVRRAGSPPASLRPSVREAVSRKGRRAGHRRPRRGRGPRRGACYSLVPGKPIVQRGGHR